MNDVDLECDVESVLLNSEGGEDFAILQRVIEKCAQFRREVITSLENKCSNEAEFAKEEASIREMIERISNQVKDAEYQLSKEIVQQKVIEKQTHFTLGQLENHRVKLEEAREWNVNLALQIVDLDQEDEEVKQKRRQKWEAIKRASHVYKSKLGIRINILETSEDYEKIRVSFLMQENYDDCYVDLLRMADGWKVESTQPAVESDQLKCAMASPSKLQVLDIRTLLCELRCVFLKHYFKH